MSRFFLIHASLILSASLSPSALTRAASPGTIAHSRSSRSSCSLRGSMYPCVSLPGRGCAGMRPDARRAASRCSGFVNAFSRFVARCASPLDVEAEGSVGIRREILRLCFAVGSSDIPSAGGVETCGGARSFVVSRFTRPGRFWPSSVGGEARGTSGKSLETPAMGGYVCWRAEREREGEDRLRAMRYGVGGRTSMREVWLG